MNLDSNQLCISTRCRTVGAFIATFRRYVAGDAVFVSTLAAWPLGAERAFVILLVDGTPILRGTCTIREAWTTADNAFGLPGILLGVTRMSPRSEEVFQALQGDSARVVEPHSNDSTRATVPQPVLYLETSPQYFSPTPRALTPPPMLASGTVEAAPLPRDERESESFSKPTLVNREMHDAPATPAEPVPSSRGVLPANPLERLSDAALAGFVDCTLYEDGTPSILGGVRQTRSRWRPPAWLWGGVAIALLAGAGIPRTSSENGVAATTPVAAPSHSDAPAAAALPDGAATTCRLDVATTPPGASVTVDGQPRGASPLTIDAACGARRVELSLPGYVTTTAWATLAAGQSTRIDIPFARPIHSVVVATRPAGATIYIDGNPAGITPKQLNVLGHVPVTLELKKRGYRPVIEHVYSTTPREQLVVPMIREAATAGPPRGASRSYARVAPKD